MDPLQRVPEPFAVNRRHPMWIVLVWISVAISAQSAEIRGVVMDNDSASPIPEATIQLLSSEGVIAETQSAENGQFEFDGSFSGRFELAASQNGYIDLFAGQRKVVAVSDRRNPPPIELRLTRACAIAGQVSDASGQPRRGAKVVAMMRRARGGKVGLVDVGNAGFTNDLGSYRLFDLAPGVYTVGVFPDGEQTGEPAFPPVYFPNVTDRLRAGFFKLASGETRTGADFTIQSLQMAKVAGTISGAPAEWSVAVRLYSGDDDLIQTVYTRGGTFTFPGVPAGSYHIIAWGPIFAGADHGPHASPHGKAAWSPINVAGGDLMDLQLELEDLRTVTGRASGDRADECSNDVRVSLKPVDPLPGAEELTAKLNHGAFAVRDVPPGRYRVQLFGLDGSCYLKQVRSGDGAPQKGIVSVSGNTQVELTLATDSATVSGKVTLPDGKSPAALAQVVLLAAEDNNTEDSVRFASSTSDGLFQFERVPPGDYQILALKKIDALDYLDPVFASEHAAARITAKPGSPATIEVTLK